MPSSNERDFPTFFPRYSLSLSLSRLVSFTCAPPEFRSAAALPWFGNRNLRKKTLSSAILTRRRFDDEHHEDPLAEGARAVLLVVATRPHVKGQNLKVKREVLNAV